ncbi:hypothetical protein ABZ635_22120 [Nocardiopsis sp. NPDC007018]|uniref:hypothetical protein n=1 Tax=Nocardiopsis sp. NPDC007018 TaxID=3155721 RepID=UPI0033E0474F
MFDIGAAEAQVGDLDLPGQDGTVFGRDTKVGVELTFELSVNTRAPDQAKREWGELATRWDASQVRRSPRAVVPLRVRTPGDRTVVVYGRPRSLERTSSLALMKVGRIDGVATFQAADAYFYDDTGPDGEVGAHSIALTLVASAGDGGIVWPVTWLVVWGSQGVRQDTVVNRGDSPSWPVITFHGPVAQPSIELVGTGRRLTLDTTLAFDRSITIDARPWARTILRDDGASFAGSARGASLSEFQLPVGQTVLAYRGTDLSGQSRCVVSWRDAYSTP